MRTLFASASGRMASTAASISREISRSSTSSSSLPARMRDRSRSELIRRACAWAFLVAASSDARRGPSHRGHSHLARVPSRPDGHARRPRAAARHRLRVAVDLVPPGRRTCLWTWRFSTAASDATSRSDLLSAGHLMHPLGRTEIERVPPLFLEGRRKHREPGESPVASVRRARLGASAQGLAPHVDRQAPSDRLAALDQLVMTSVTNDSVTSW
jgi:hypothetical protein